MGSRISLEPAIASYSEASIQWRTPELTHIRFRTDFIFIATTEFPGPSLCANRWPA